MAIGRVNTGGGAGMNFDVKAYSSALLFPASAKENTIGVITTDAITEWVIGSTQPTTRLDGSALSGGEVWINSEGTSSAPINVLKKNAAYLYPSTCQQYIDGAWLKKTALVYQNGTWVSLLVYLYNKGDECTDLTGGWEARARKAAPTSTAGIAPTLTKNDNNMRAVFTGAGVVQVKTDIDLTEISSITMLADYTMPSNGSTNNELILAVGSRSADYFSTNAIAKTQVPAGTDQITVVDVSAITGSYDVYFGMRPTGSSYPGTVVAKSIFMG